MTSTHKNDNVSSPSTPSSSGATSGSGTGTSGHKNSLKSSKLARRARSFKEMKDGLFEKISQIRTPTNTLGRSHSPSHRRSVEKQNEETKPIDALERNVRDIKNALKHFKDVISKKKYEVLAGNGTIIIELAHNMCSALQSQTSDSQTIQSALNQVYLSLAKLLKLCDEILICEDENDCASLNDENVKEIITLVESAVQNLFTVAIEKIGDKENSTTSSNTLCKPTTDAAGQRASFPDISLTPNERSILEKTSNNSMRASHSTESILRSSSPPPKPPLPASRNQSNPPPLPPKRRINYNSSNNNNNLTTNNNCNSQRIQNTPIENESNVMDKTTHLGVGIDQLSLRSKSPDDNSSLLSASAGSLDSAFNHSREEEELKALSLETSFEDQHLLENEINMAFSRNNTPSKKLEKNISISDNNNENKNSNRRSNESGFVSIRGSTQSGGSSTKRSSGHSIQSHKSGNQLISMNNIDNISGSTVTSTSSNNSTKFETYQQHQLNIFEEHQHQQHHTVKSVTSTLNPTSINNNEQNIQRFQQLTTNNLLNSTTTATTSSTFKQSSIKTQQITGSTTTSTSSISPLSSQLSLTSGAGNLLSNNLNINASTTMNSLHSTSSLQSNEHKIINSNIMEQNISITGDEFNQSLGNISDEIDNLRSISPLTPPALPAKTRIKRDVFQYEKKTDEMGFNQGDFGGLRSTSTSNFVETRHQSMIDRRWGDIPPPLPAKKKHIIAYMEICSNSSRSHMDTFRHSVHAYNMNTSNSSDSFSPSRSLIHSQTMNLQNFKQQMSQNSLSSSIDIDEKPPALPPKRQPKINNCRTPTIITTPPQSPKPNILLSENNTSNSNSSCTTTTNDISRGNKKVITETMTTLSEETNENVNDDVLENKNQRDLNSSMALSDVDDDEGQVILRNCDNLTPQKLPPGINLMEEIDVADYLIFKKEGEDGPDIKGGYLDALIVYASKLHKTNENDEDCDAFGEAFLTTFRTFIQPVELIKKLIHRYNFFICETQKKKIARETYALLYRVVNDLTASDVKKELYTILTDFVYSLVSMGELSDAKIMRNKLVEKIILSKELKYGGNLYEPQRNIVTNQPTLLDLKSSEIAEQMTLLDAELFQKIEIPEILLFAKDQCDEKTPNLNKFTEHFNKMSYWARSQILKQDDAKDREKHVIKFIKIMKNLRKMNNYNSYLALLSALDSGPIRRLEWHKTITEGLKEYCALIDSSLSFRVYRQALADTNPPCIPYIGLVLQDLTFVHVGNPDHLKDGIINFSKRWQQHNIIVNMKRFKSCAYTFRRNEKIIQFFENFENFLGEEQMWQISENIKPRGKRPTNN